MSQAAAAADVTPKAMGRMLVLAVVVGVLAAAGGSLFLEVIHLGESFVFDTVPSSMGFDEAPWWWAALLLLLGASIVLLGRQMPGATGKGPLTGFHFDNPLVIVPSILVAALGTLVFGFVLGPEAPLIVLGTAIGALLTWRADKQARQVAMLLGGVAAIGAVLGNPFVTGFMILEFAAFGLVPAVILPAAFVALGAGFLTQVGIDGLPGFGLHTLEVPGVPAYDQIAFGDVLLGLLVAVLAAVVTVAVRESAVAIDRAGQRRPIPMLYVAAVVTALVLLIAQVGFGIAQDQILFSGQSGMGALVQETSIAAVIVIIVGKGIAYAVALGGGLRGGPIFPATFLGVAAGVLVSLIVPAASVSPLAAAGIAASAAAMIKLPGTSALLGAALIGGSGAAIAPFAIFGAVIGLLVRTVVDRKLGVRQAEPATTPTEDPGVAAAS
jgi:H+/Cl- antiporter ClcA